MNKDAIIKTAELIEGLHKDEFDLQKWLCVDSDCGTVGCIAGWGAICATAEKQKSSIVRAAAQLGDLYGGVEVVKKTSRYFGIDEKVATVLFTPMSIDDYEDKEDIPKVWPLSAIPKNKRYRNVTPKIAGKVLRILAKTGKVNWDAAFAK